MKYGWRVLVEHDFNFAKDQLKLYVAFSNEQGMRMLKPLSFQLGDYVEVTVPDVPNEPTFIPRELAEQIYAKLGYLFIGTNDSLHEINRLQTELNKANIRLEKLIDGIGRMGGHA